MRKKKLVFQSDYALAKTGFGRNTRAILTYLYNTNKYDLVNYCCGIQWSNPALKATPWKSIGTLPDNPATVDQLNKNPGEARLASYGAFHLDDVIKQEKPDVYIAVQDIWGIDFAASKPWFNKISSVLWTTLDSLPILPTAIEAATKSKNFWVWSNFAEKAMTNTGLKHIKTLHGSVDTKYFKRLLNHEKTTLRQKFNIGLDEFVVGFVFRNQLRKSVPNLLEGYSLFKKSNPKVKTRLLLHTNFTEGWKIPKLADQYGVNQAEIITTYICKNCKNYHVAIFNNNDADCPACKASKSCNTTSVALGVTETQLNEVYNLMDVYCHPFTSGGQEIPIQEAKCAELITLVTDYSCGEEMCEESAASLPLQWTKYTEHDTEFIKASTSPSSIAKQLDKVLAMPIEKRRELGKMAKEWAIKNFSVENVGKKIEEFIDAADFADYKEDFFVTKSDDNPNPNADIGDLKEEGAWLKNLYEKILGRAPDEGGFAFWKDSLAKGKPRPDIEKFFREVALKTQNDKKSQSEVMPIEAQMLKILDKDDEGRRILYVIPESIGDVYLSTALFKNIKQTYPEYNLYVATKPEYFDVIACNPHVHRVISYIPQMDNLLWLEGRGDYKGLFDIAFLAHLGTQRMLNYIHNGKTRVGLDLKSY